MRNHKEMFEALLSGEILKGPGHLRALSEEGFLKDQLGEEVNDFADLNPFQWRVIQKTIIINGIAIPAPLKRMPDGFSGEYFVPVLTNVGGPLYLSIQWAGGNADLTYLRNGVVHLSANAAETHAEALLSFTRGLE